MTAHNFWKIPTFLEKLKICLNHRIRLIWMVDDVNFSWRSVRAPCCFCIYSDYIVPSYKIPNNSKILYIRNSKSKVKILHLTRINFVNRSNWKIGIHEFESILRISCNSSFLECYFAIVYLKFSFRIINKTLYLNEISIPHKIFVTLQTYRCLPNIYASKAFIFFFFEGNSSSHRYPRRLYDI